MGNIYNSVNKNYAKNRDTSVGIAMGWKARI
jgi:hypothetical protein